MSESAKCNKISNKVNCDLRHFGNPHCISSYFTTLTDCVEHWIMYTVIACNPGKLTGQTPHGVLMRPVGSTRGVTAR